MALHTDTLVVAVQDRYENTDQPLNSIGAEFGISGRTVSRMANEHGWKKRSERVRDVPPAMQLLDEAKALAVVSPPPARGRSDRVAVRVGVNSDETTPAEETPTQDVTPTLTLPPIEVGFIRLRSPECQTRAGPSLDGGGNPSIIPEKNLSAIDRLEALVVQQIEAEEIKRSLYAGKRRAKTTDDRCARTLATLTQTLHALQRLRAGKNPERETFHADYDDMPRDIDEFRRALARRIDAFVTSRTNGGDADAAFDMLQFGLRLGKHPRQLVTTTPRPIPLIKRLLADPRTAVTRAATQANAAHLSPSFLDEVLARYAGTRLGRQEIDGEIIEDRQDALWTRAMIEAARVDKTPPLMRIVVGIDPPASSREGADACGIVAAGRDDNGCVYVLEDATASGLAPDAWAMRAIALYRRHKADALVAEVNQGGDMVGAVLRNVDPSVPLKMVHATRGKYVRAEPVAALYAQGKVKHVAPMPELEDQMCDFGLGAILLAGCRRAPRPTGSTRWSGR